MFNVAIIGAGSMSRTHIQSYEQNPHTQVKWVVDINQDNAKSRADEFGIAGVAGDYRQVLEDPSVDLISIVTPNDLHAPISVEALEAGKHVICEKPMSTTTQECDKMIAADAKANARLFVKYHQRFDPVHRRVKELLETGEFPKPVMSLARWFANHMGSMQDPGHWRGDRARTGGGCLFSSGSHTIDLFHFFHGDVKAVTAVNRRLVSKDPSKDDDNASCILEFESGLVVTFVGSWSCLKYHSLTQEIHSLEESLHLSEGRENGVRVNRLTRRRDGKEEHVIEESDWWLKSNFLAFDHFIDCIKNDKEPEYSLADSRKSIETLNAIYKASDEGRRIVLAEEKINA